MEEKNPKFGGKAKKRRGLSPKFRFFPDKQPPPAQNSLPQTHFREKNPNFLGFEEGIWGETRNFGFFGKSWGIWRQNPQFKAILGCFEHLLWGLGRIWGFLGKDLGFFGKNWGYFGKLLPKFPPRIILE